LRSSIPPGYKFIAVVVAAATACGLYAFLRYGEAQLALAASLSFDSAVAQQLDPGDTSAPDPAVVLGQSILSDSVVAGLVPQTPLAASAPADAIGEFRTRLELTQPAAGLLRVRYRDPDPAQAATTANAVAKALAEWSLSTTSARPRAANARLTPAPGPKRVPASGAAPQHTAAAEQHAAGAELSLATALGELQAQLSAADQRASAGAGAESPSQSEHDRQRHLESQVRAAQQKLEDLRNEFAHSGSASGGQARLDAIQQALALFWPSAAGLNTAGTSEAQLDYEREQLSRDIGVIEQQHQAAQRAEAANSASANRPSQQTAPLAWQPQPAAAAVAISPPVSGAGPNPFHLERMAGLPAPVAWWPSALIGCFCGLLYWGVAFVRYRSSPESDDLLDLPEESAPSANRLLNIDAAVLGDSRAEWIEVYPAETSSRKRASFTFDPDSTSAPVPDQSPSAPIQGSTADPVPDNPTEPATLPIHTDIAEAAFAAEAASKPIQSSIGNTVPDSLTEPATFPIHTDTAEAASARKRASFTFDPDFTSTPVPDQSPSSAPIQCSTTDTVPDNLTEPAESPTHIATAQAASAADAAPMRAPEEQSKIFHEKAVEMADSWEEEIRKKLSQTTVARMLDPQIVAEDAAAAKGPARDVEPPPSETDRLAG
jgi:hypothetical protein